MLAKTHMRTETKREVLRLLAIDAKRKRIRTYVFIAIR